MFEATNAFKPKFPFFSPYFQNLTFQIYTLCMCCSIVNWVMLMSNLKINGLETTPWRRTRYKHIYTFLLGYWFKHKIIKYDSRQCSDIHPLILYSYTSIYNKLQKKEVVAVYQHQKKFLLKILVEEAHA